MAKLFFLVVVLSVLIGCGPADSLNPLFADKDVVFDRALLGTWGGQDPKDGYFLFERAGDNGYRISMVDENGNVAEYDAHLGYVQGRRFLDLVPVASDSHWQALAGSELTVANPDGNNPVSNPGVVKLGDNTYLEFTHANSDNNKTHFKVNVRAAHWFCKVATEGSLLRLDCLDDKWLKNHGDDANTHLAYESAGPGPDDRVITSSTSELQKFVTEQAENTEAFSFTMAAKRLSLGDSLADE